MPNPDTAQCPTCREAFVNDSWFRAHRDRRTGRCLPPTQLGLICLRGVWSTVLEMEHTR